MFLVKRFWTKLVSESEPGAGEREIMYKCWVLVIPSGIQVSLV